MQPSFDFEYRHGDSEYRPLSWGLDARHRPDRKVLELLDSDSPAADLWEIAGSCFAVDREILRPRIDGWRSGKPEWSRLLTLRLPVRRYDFWREHGHLVENVLGWMTGDEWTLEFRPDTRDRPGVQTALFYESGPETVLFSGGLDSTAGVAAALHRRPDAGLHLVTVMTNTRQERYRKDLTKALTGLCTGPGRLDPNVFLLTMLNKGGKPYRPRETSARTRGFVFLSAAIATAAAHQSRVIRVYENGTGAMNLACSQGQIGAQSARPVHPRTLKLMERIACAVAEHRIRIENPYEKTTKAELVAQVPAEYDGILDATVSCDTGFSRRTAAPHCGVCTSCLLRLQSIVASGKRLTPPDPRNGPKIKRAHPRAMMWQVDRFRHALGDGPSWERLVREFPDIVCVPGAFDPAQRHSLVALFSRYAQEWQNEELTSALGGLLNGTES